MKSIAFEESETNARLCIDNTTGDLCAGVSQPQEGIMGRPELKGQGKSGKATPDLLVSDRWTGVKQFHVVPL